MPIPDTSEIKRILVMKWSALGDIALATTAIEDLRSAFPHAVMHLDTLPPARHLFAADPRFDAVFAFDLRGDKRRLLVHRRWLHRVRAARYDLVVDLQGADHSRLLLACLAIGRHKVRHRWGIRPGFPYTLGPAADCGPHVLQRMRSLLSQAGLDARTLLPVLYPSARQRENATACLHELNAAPGRYAVFLPGSQRGSRIKRWSCGHYAELGLLLHRHGIERILVIGAQAEAEECRNIVAVIEAKAPGVAFHLAELEMLEIIPACAGAVCIIANDTGTAHVAAATGRPLWVLCGPTDPRRVRPPGAHAIQADHACLNCYRKSCRWGSRARCLDLIEPASVLALVLGDIRSAGGLNVFSDPATTNPMPPARELDVRPLLQAGDESFKTIMNTVRH